MITKNRIFGMMPPPMQDSLISWHLKHKRERLRHATGPEAVIFYVTNRCNLRCSHCFYWRSLDAAPRELTLSEIGQIADSLGSPISLSLTGGEPFLRQDLPAVADLFVEKKKVRELAIATNGYYTNEIVRFCDGFIDRHPRIGLSVQVSIDGLEETHDSIRRHRGSYRRGLETVRRLKVLAATNESFSVSAAIALQKRNLAELPSLVAMLASQGVPLRINLLRGESVGTFGVTGDISSHIDPPAGDNDAVSVGEAREAYEELCRLTERYGFWSRKHRRIFEVGLLTMEKKARQVECFAGRIDAVIYANGDLAFCELTRPVGNLRDCGFDVSRLWQSREAAEMRERTKSCFCTHGCNLSTSMMFDPEMVKDALIPGARA